MSPEPALAKTAERLREARHALHDVLAECVGEEQPCRILEEDHGLISVGHPRQQGRLPYLYVHRYVEVSSSGYPPRKRERSETLAHTWKIESERHGRVEVTLTIDTKRSPQLLLKPDYQRFPGTPDGWRELAAHLCRPE